jgi:hypothetical protein
MLPFVAHIGNNQLRSIIEYRINIMNLPHVPPAITCDSGHAEIVIICLIIISVLFYRSYKSEKKKREIEDTVWHQRIEDKLDNVLSEHSKCQAAIAERFASKTDRSEFIQLIKERTEAWIEFNKKFDTLMDMFKNHTHRDSGEIKY